MKEQDVVFQLIDELEAALPSAVAVRTAGGDQDIDTPEAILSWSTTRVPDGNGHSSFGDYITDVNGNHVGIEYHAYWEMEADVLVRTQSESDRDTYIDDVHSQFIPYEHYKASFHKDTRLWDVGPVGPRENAAIEPDWYEGGCTISFEFLKRTEVTGMDAIESVEKNIDATYEN